MLKDLIYSLKSHVIIRDLTRTEHPMACTRGFSCSWRSLLEGWAPARHRLAALTLRLRRRHVAGEGS
jgi:hypothetical protein